MSELLVKISGKTVSCQGDVSVGERVALKIVNGGRLDTSGEYKIRFRIVDEGGFDLVRFPAKAGDVWGRGDDITAIVDFNTEHLRKVFEQVSFSSKLKLGVIIDSWDERIQYGRGFHYIQQWSVASEDAPSTLADWKDMLEEIRISVADAQRFSSLSQGYSDESKGYRDSALNVLRRAEQHENNCNSHATSASQYNELAKNNALSASSAAQSASSSASSSLNSMNTAHSHMVDAQSAMNAARDYAAQALEASESFGNKLIPGKGISIENAPSYEGVVSVAFTILTGDSDINLKTFVVTYRGDIAKDFISGGCQSANIPTSKFILPSGAPSNLSATISGTESVISIEFSPVSGWGESGGYTMTTSTAIFSTDYQNSQGDISVSTNTGTVAVDGIVISNTDILPQLETADISVTLSPNDPVRVLKNVEIASNSAFVIDMNALADDNTHRNYEFLCNFAVGQNYGVVILYPYSAKCLFVNKPDSFSNLHGWWRITIDWLNSMMFIVKFEAMR